MITSAPSWSRPCEEGEEMLQIGSVFDRKYKILEEIGHGGMSTVYLARNERANKTWAIKEVRKNGETDNEISSQSLLAEVDMLKRLDHPNIVNIVDVVENEESFIIVMDYIQGQDLMSVIRSNGAIDPDTVIRWMKQLCDVMWYLHSQRPPIIYRDMKPANVMLKPDGDVIVIDFGTARTNKGGNVEDTTCLGTKGYAAPEQFGGQGETDARTDIYTLGTTMYHLLTGYSPADTDFYIYPIGQLRPELKDSGIEAIVAKCCQPSRENRYQTAAELMYDLEHVHDKDLEVQKKDKSLMRMFLVPVITFLIGAAATFGFYMAQNATIQNTYESSIQKAKNSETFAEAFKNLESALRMQPENPEIYNVILGKITNDKGDTDFDANDDRILSELKKVRPVGSKEKTSFEVFKERMPADYDKFMYDLGVMYFQYYDSGSYKYAKEALEGLENSPYLSERDKNLARSYSLICSVVVTNTNTGGTSRIFDETRKSWYNVYEEFNNLIGNPDTTRDKCGGTGAAFAVIRTFASLAERKITNFKDAGVTEAELRQLIEAGDEFLNRETGDGNYSVVQREAFTAVRNAKVVLSGKTDTTEENS